MESQMKPSIWSELADFESKGIPHVLVMLLETRGSAPQTAGAKMVVCEHGMPIGTVGGGKIEAAAIRVAREMMAEEGPAVELREVVWNLQRDIGMTCGGEARMVFHVRRFSAWTIAIFGAGHIVQALVPLLQRLDASVLCFDTRAEWLEKLPGHPRLRARVVEDLAEEVGELPDRAFVLCITQGHGTDLPILERVFQRGGFPFVGCIGSEVKARKVRSELETAGIAHEALERLRCPIGLPLGGNDPNEIAISIAAQLLQERDLAGR
jgi:xanthine dehydrogenase accessory factor